MAHIKSWVSDKTTYAIQRLLSHEPFKCVSDVTRGKDGVVKTVEIKYFNYKEKDARFTTRALRSIVKLFHIDEVGFQDEMGELERFLHDLRHENKQQEDKVPPIRLSRTKDDQYKIVNSACDVLYTLNMDLYEFPGLHGGVHYEAEDDTHPVHLPYDCYEDLHALLAVTGTDFDL